MRNEESSLWGLFEGTNLSAIGLGLFLTTPLLELHATHVHDGRGDLVDVILLLLSEAQHVEGLLLSGETSLNHRLGELFASEVGFCTRELDSRYSPV